MKSRTGFSILLLFIISLSLGDFVECSSKRPLSVEASKWCNICQAIVREMIKKLKNKRKEYEVLEAYDGICNYELFYVYNHPPPEMEKACKLFVQEHEDDIVDGIRLRKDNDSAENDICNDRTEACLPEDDANEAKTANGEGSGAKGTDL